MLQDVVRLTVSLTVHEGHMDTFHTIVQAMTSGSDAEPGTLGYEWFAHKDGKRYRLVETYTNAAAVEAHFLGTVVQEWVPRLAAICTVESMEFYGDPGPVVSQMAAGFGAVIFGYVTGISR